MFLDSENLPDASSRKRKLYRLVVVSFGLLCLLQAAVNISLRLTLYARLTEFEAIIKNLTEEGDSREFKRKVSTFDFYVQQGWIYFNHTFYHVSSIKKSWQQSRDDCLQRGADLMVINSKEEQEFARQFNRPIWIGLNNTEGSWKWVDGTLLNISFWSTGEPNNAGADENCVQIRLYARTNGWNDLRCERPNFWICEKMVPL